MGEELQLIVFPSDDKHAIGYIIGKTSEGLVVHKLAEFRTLEHLEFHAYRVLDYVAKIRKGSIPQAVIEAFNEEEKSEG